MNIQQFIEQIAQGQYEAFRQYLNTGNNGGPITSLDLSSSFREIPNRREFLEHLFEALKTNATLTKLNLGGNNIDHDSAAAIAQVLNTNATLSELSLWGNFIGEKGTTAIARADVVPGQVKYG